MEISYEGDMLWTISGKRIEQIVRMTDFANPEAVMRVYDILERLGMIRKVESQLTKICESQGRDNSFFFEGSEDDDITPVIRIGERDIPLEKLKFDI